MGINAKAVKAILKKSGRIHCQVVDDGAERKIWVCDGTFAATLTGDEYQEAVQPVVCCEAGNWEYSAGEKHDGKNMDISGLVARSAAATDHAESLERCPLIFPDKNRDIAGLLHRSAGFVVIVNDKIRSIFPDCEYRTTGKLAAVVCYDAGNPVGVFMPVKSDDTHIPAAVRAYLEAAPEKDAAGTFDELNRLRAELKALSDKLAATESRLQEVTAAAEDMQSELFELTEEKAFAVALARSTVEEMKAQTEEHKAALASRSGDPKNPRDAISEALKQFSKLPGVLATVKGERSATPVIWLSGSVEANAEALRAAGAVWSKKRSAFYYRPYAA